MIKALLAKLKSEPAVVLSAVAAAASAAAGAPTWAAALQLAVGALIRQFVTPVAAAVEGEAA